MLKAKLPELSVTSAFCQHAAQNCIPLLNKWEQCAGSMAVLVQIMEFLWESMYLHFAQLLVQVFCVIFFPLDMLLHWYRFNLVALVHNMHGIEMSIGTAFVLQSANRSSNSHKIGSLNIFQGERNLLIFYQWPKSLPRSDSELGLTWLFCSIGSQCPSRSCCMCCAASLLFSAQRMRLERFNIHRLGSSCCSTRKSPGQGVKQAVASCAQLSTAAVEMLSLKQVLLCVPKGFF